METFQSIDGEGDLDQTVSVPSPTSAQEPLTSLEFITRTNPDFVLVWNNLNKEAITKTSFEKRSVFEYNLGEKEGLILEWESIESVSHLQALKIWAPLEVLKRYSEILKLRLPMNQLELELPHCISDNSSQRSSASANSLKKSSLNIFSLLEQNIKEFSTCFQVDTKLFPKKCRRLTGIYSRDKEYLYDVNESNMHEIFPISTRARVVQYILKRTPYKVGDELERDAFAFGFERLIQQGVYEAGYPLHDGKISTEGSTRKLLYDNWGKVTTGLKHQPLDSIKDYFGVNIALYFAWLGYYTRMLAIAAFFGVFCFLYGLFSFSGDQFVNDVCNKSIDITMCPLCDYSCGYWKLSDKCFYSKFTHLLDNDFTVLFALLMSVWTAVFIEFWKRYSAQMTHQWDLSSFDSKDYNPRPEYVAELKRIYPRGSNSMNPNKDEDEGENGPKKEKIFDFDLSIPFWKRKLPFTLFSYTAVLFLVVLALAVLVGVIMYRVWFTLWLSKLGSSTNEVLAWKGITVTITAAFLNLTFIVLFGKVYERIAARLTELEYPRTQPEYDASYTLKIYLLQFINNYSSIFYVAFFKGVVSGAPNDYHKLFGVLRQEECGISCMPELCIQLAIIMIGKQFRNMIIEAFIPWFRRILNRISARLKVAVSSENRRPSLHKASVQWATDYDLLEWGHFSLIDEYLEMVLQFGFTTIFVSAFPLAPLFALINNILELRLDAGKMLVHFRRPVGLRVKDIGVWTSILDAIVKIAVLSNACIIALTSNFIPKFMYRYFLLPKSNPNYGTLHGYLINSLTIFSTSDLETKPDASVLRRTGDSPVCYFPTYRNNYTSPDKYQFRTEHWQIWLARVIFVILYENVVALIILFLRWIIPDVSNDLKKKIQKEEKMVNDLILKQEQLRSQKSASTTRYRNGLKLFQNTSNNEAENGLDIIVKTQQNGTVTE